LEENIRFFREILGNSNDIKIHEFIFSYDCKFNEAIIYIDGLVNNLEITRNILKPILLNENLKKDMLQVLKIKDIRKTIMSTGNIEESNNYLDLFEGCLSRNTILLVNGLSTGLIIGTQEWAKRGVTEPQTEAVIRGPREGFTEDFKT